MTESDLRITTNGVISEEMGTVPSRFRQFGGMEIEGEIREEYCTVDIVFQNATMPPLGLVQVNGESLMAFSI